MIAQLRSAFKYSDRLLMTRAKVALNNPRVKIS